MIHILDVDGNTFFRWIGDQKFNLMPTHTKVEKVNINAIQSRTYALAAPIVRRADAAILKETILMYFSDEMAKEFLQLTLVHFLKCDEMMGKHRLRKALKLTKFLVLVSGG